MALESKIEKLFQGLSEEKPSVSLEQSILSEISHFKRKRIQKRMLIGRLGMIFSGALAGTAFFFFGRSLTTSGFWDILSLAFSDAGFVIGHGESFLYSLLENLPLFDVLALTLPAYALLWSFSFFFKNRRFLKLENFQKKTTWA